MQFPLFILFAGNGSGAKFLSRPLGASADSQPIVQQWVPKNNLLSFEEIERVVRIAVGLGIQKIRLTGGEPLLRRGVEDLVSAFPPFPGSRIWP